MNNGDMPANPAGKIDTSTDPFVYSIRQANGLTKREYFAGLAMQGMLSSSDYAASTWKTVAIEAVEVADALLKELEK